MTLTTSSIASAQPAQSAQGGWIDLDEAARRSGKSVGHLRRLCGDVWLADGKAKLTRPADGGKPTWFVREDADGKFARVKTVEQLSAEFDVRQLTAAQQSTLRQRERIVRDWCAALDGGNKLGFREHQVTSQFIGRLAADGVSVAMRTLYNWRAAYRRRGIAGLIDERWRKPENARPDDPFFEELKRLYLDQRKRSKQLCYDRTADLAREQGWEIPSYRSACRYLGEIPAKVIALHRGGEEEFAAKAGRYIERDYTTIASNDVWVGDHHQFDVMVNAGGDKPVRPWLTAWMDMRSRVIVGYRIFAHDPNSDTILGAFYDACHPQRNDHGVPKSVYIDNGKDYDSYALQGRTKKQRRRGDAPLVNTGVFGELGVEVRHATPYRPQSKTIERFFGTVADRFSKLWETYCGSSPATKPEDLPLRLTAGRAPALAEFSASFADWLTADYHNEAHDGDGMNGQSPLAVFAANLASKRTLPAAMFDVLLLRQTQPVKVGRVGVRFNGLLYGRDEKKLWGLLGKDVVLRVDDRDLRKVKVFDLEGRWICDADANTQLPVLADSQTLREAVREGNRDKKLAKEFVQRRPRMADSLTDRIFRKAAQRRAQQPAASPSSIQPIQTPVEGAFDALQEAMERTRGRVAVGGESFSFEDVSDALRRQRPANSADDDEAEDTFEQLGAAMRLADEEECK